MKTNVSLEVLHRKAESPSGDHPPLLFIHGAFCGAWCWDEHFLPWFARHGCDAHALSLSGHGGNPDHDHLDSLSIADYVRDVRSVVESLDRPPVLIGHSMGGFVVQKYLEQYSAPAAVLMCSVPPQGLMGSAMSMLFSRPTLLGDLNTIMAGGQASYESLREALFAQDIPLDDLIRFYKLSQPESHRAIWDMMLFSLPRIQQVLANIQGGRSHLLVQGAEFDHLVPVSAAEMTARSYGVAPLIYPAMGHGLMLEKDWEKVASGILSWLHALGLATKP
ncbi:alpha/beta hydrolase [Denitratisoma sp. agr-D3]